MITSDTIKNLDDTLTFIHEHEREFIQNFMSKWYNSIIELVDVSFNTEKVKFYCVLDCGTTVGYDCSIVDLNNWINSLFEVNK